MQELGGEKTRRNTLSIILRIFVETEGSRNIRQTLARDLWPEYAQQFTTSSMLPAYLVQIIASSEVARDATALLNRRYAPGAPFKSAELRIYLMGKYGERKVVLNAGSAFLKTLQHFGILEAGTKWGDYTFCQRVKPDKEIFPLIIWAMWHTNPAPQIDLEHFIDQVELSFLNMEDWELYWKAFQPTLWALSERLGAYNATLKYPERAAFEEQLLRSILRT
jgi:hypothetical protein